MRDCAGHVVEPMPRCRSSRPTEPRANQSMNNLNAAARNPTHCLTREELYERARTEPMRELAPKLGYSDRSLAKACEPMRILVPGREYWALKEVGRAPKRIPLPKLPASGPTSLTELTF